MEEFIRNYSELRPFVLTNVTSTGYRIGGGAYSRVEDVTIICAAKKIVHDVSVNAAGDRDAAISNVSKYFVEECKLMSTLRHPNIVQFLGVAFFPGLPLPTLVMERLLTSLHGLLAPDPRPPPDAITPLAFFSMALKCSVLHDVASGLAYLHELSQPVIHRNLTAKNILLNSEMVAKIGDLGVARIVSDANDSTVMTKAPGNSLYMPPEASENAEEVMYNASIDVFSLGVVTIFTIGETSPSSLPAPNYIDRESGKLLALTELQRRGKYMRYVNEQLRANSQLRGDHPLIRLIQQCLDNLPAKRPGIREVLHLLEEARAGVRDEESERNKHELTVLLQPRKQLSREEVDTSSLHETRARDLEKRIRDLEEEKEATRQELQHAQTRADQLQLRLNAVQNEEDKKPVAQDHAVEVYQRSPSWEVTEEELELTDEELGRGAWAVVKVAKLKVAAKCLHADLIFDYHRDQFRREMEVAARVSHPNLLRFLGARLEGGMTILTELMPTSLRALVNRHPRQRLPLEHTLSIAIDVARALDYLHNIIPDPIVHRDLSSANVLLQPTVTGGWLAKVSDYGTANFKSKILTKNPGSPAYNAPESNDPDLQTPKMDIYSFGVLLVEMYTCDFPSPQRRAGLMESIRHSGLFNLITQCLNKDKDQRPTAANLIDFLLAMH